MGSNAQKKPRFYKILGGVDFERRLRIPQSFVYRHLANEISEMATLLGPTGRIWQTKVQRSTNDMYLTTGWESFMKDHSLTKGELLLLRYNGNMCFSVSIFGGDTCERQDDFTATANSQGNKRQDTPPIVEGKKRGRPPRAEKNKSGRSPKHARCSSPTRDSDKAQGISPMTTAELSDSSIECINDRCDGPAKVFERKKQDSSSQKTASEPNQPSIAPEVSESISYTRNEGSDGPTKGVERRKRGRPRKTTLDPCKQSNSPEECINERLNMGCDELAKDFERKKHDSSPQKTALKPSQPSNVPKACRESLPKLNASKKGMEENITAHSFTSQFPFFNMKMQAYNVKPPFYMPFPFSFVKFHLPKRSQELFLLCSNGKDCPVSYIFDKKGSGLNNGWDAFCFINNVEVNDECIFELVEADKLRVHIFRSGS